MNEQKIYNLFLSSIILLISYIDVAELAVLMPFFYSNIRFSIAVESPIDNFWDLSYIVR